MKKIATLLLMICAIHSHAQNKTSKPSFSVVFDSAKGSLLLHQCSRAAPNKVAAFWTPRQQDIDIMESNFSRLDAMTAKDCCGAGSSVGNLERYGAQYIGVIINGRKYIYINAFSMRFLKEKKERDQHFDPAEVPLTVCDGGPGFWGVLFDMESKKFSQLSFNGAA